MKDALVGGQPVPASPSAPATAACPYCEGVVELRNRQGTWFWRHVKRPRGGCQPTAPGSGPAPTDADDAPTCRMRQVGDLVIELHLDDDDAYGGHLKLRSSIVKADGQTSGVVIHFSEVRLLAQALLDIVEAGG